MFTLLVATILLLVSIATSPTESASVLTIYNQTFQYGTFKLVTVSGCTDLEDDWQRQTTALDLHDNCFQFYSRENCRGKRVTLQPFHKKYLDNLKSIDFDDTIVSVSECGKRVRPGPHLVRSVADGSLVTLTPMKTDFFANTVMRPWQRHSIQQVWEVRRYGPRIGINYGMHPLNYRFYNPVTYTTFEPRRGASPYMPERYFDIKPLSGGKYLVKILHSDKCLVNRGIGRPIGKTQCAPWLSSQQFYFFPVRLQQEQNPDGSNQLEIVPAVRPILE